MSDRPEFNYVYYIGHAAKVGGRILDHGCGLFARSDDRTLATLDVLRGIAILLVLVAHFLPFDGPIANAMLLSCANAGVILFFFLSGFLMDRTFAQDSQILPYVVRRAFRILPMYWISIILIFLLEREWSVRDAIANATFTTQVMHVRSLLDALRRGCILCARADLVATRPRHILLVAVRTCGCVHRRLARGSVGE
jgi:hypothetical protein